MDNKDKMTSGFSYTYSAKEQAELKKIREKYEAPTESEDKMARLMRLDASVTEVAQAIALAFGIIGTLILGTGMSLIMTDLSESLALSRNVAVIIGVICGVIGGALASVAYPIYCRVVKSRRKKLAPEILRLTEELMK